MAEIITKDRKEYNIWDKINGVWNRLNFLTNAKSVDADDGKDLQTKVGAINGITSDLTGEAEDIAASIKCVNQLNSSLNVRYNSENDTVEIFYNGQWNKCTDAGKGKSNLCRCL